MMDSRRTASLRILIDGYNLLHQSPVMGKPRGRNWLARARIRLVEYVAKLLTAQERDQTMIVFDAGRTGAANHADEILYGIYVTYAAPGQEADDIVELLVRQHPTPRLLTVVSSDHRLQRCANSRRAQPIDSDVWLSKRLSNLQLPDSQPNDLKPEISAQEIAEFMQQFGFKPMATPGPASESSQQASSDSMEKHAPHMSMAASPKRENFDAESRARTETPKRVRRVVSQDDLSRCRNQVSDPIPNLAKLTKHPSS